MTLETTAGMQPEDLLDNLPTFGSPPVVYRRLATILDDPRKGVHEATAVIQEDPALTVRVLRVVNSAYYSFPRRIETVREAVHVLGMNQLRDLALATSVTSLFRDIPPELVTSDDFWRHSVGCGAAARVLADVVGAGDKDRYFVAGMLHDIGRLVLFLGAPEAASKAVRFARDEKIRLVEAEQQVLGFDHALIGGALMDRWRMSASLQDSVRWHHEPAAAQRDPLGAAIVHMADVLANAMELGSSAETTVPPPTMEALTRLGIRRDQVRSIIADVDEQVAESFQAFGSSAAA